MSAPEGDKNNANNKTTFGAIDLAPKVLVRPTEKANIFTGHSTYRTISPNMRLVLPQGSTLPSNYIRQTINIRPDPSATTTRAQITALPARTITQTSITVSQAGQRCTIATPIRTPPVSISNISSGIFRPVNPTSRTSSPSATIISQTNAGNWNTVQVPTQIIRATSIPTGRPRVVTQIATNQGTQNLSNATITANLISQVTSQSNQQQMSQNVVGNQPQTYVATLATVLPPQKTATLLYTNPQQPYSTGNNQQRLTLATTTLAAQRHIRPTIQRLPTANIRVNTSNISIRQPSTPILTQTNVLTTIPNTIQRPATSTISAANLTGSIPARIIQVQQQGLVQPQQGGTTTQVISARNLMTLQPVVVNNNRAIVNNSGLQQGLTIAHVGKITSSNPGDGQNSTANLTANLSGSTIQTVSSNQSNNNSATIISGNLQNPQQITQIVNLNQNQAPQIITVTQSQILSSQNQPGTTTVVPLAIAATSRNTAIPVSLSGQNQIIVSSVRGITTTTSTTGNISSTTMPTILPIAKVLPQINAPSVSNQETSVSMTVAQPGTGPSVFIQARPPQTSISAIQQQSQQLQTVNKVVSGPSGTTFLPTSQAFYYEHVAPSTAATSSQSATTTTVTTTVAKLINAPFTITSTSASNLSNVTNTTSSFVAVPISSRNLIHGIVPAVSAAAQAKLPQVQTIPVRINQIVGHSEPPQQISVSQPQQIIVPASASGPQQHIIIQGPIAGKGSPSPRGPSILRKRDSSPVKAKNLTEALMAMGKDRNRDRELSPTSRSPSTDGSTTVSATSSPGIEQQEQEGMAFSNNTEMQFKPVDEGYPPPATTNGSFEQSSPKKKVRKQLNMSDLSIEPIVEAENRTTGAIPKTTNNLAAPTPVNNVPIVMVKEEEQPIHQPNENNNTIPIADVSLKKPTTSLLQSYKQTWKAANNHFQRYSDVRKRDERPASVIDLANQAHVLQKVNGWKIYHLSSQIEDLSDLETQAYDKLNQLLSTLENSAKPSPELERINDLLKGNMQRSKIIIDGINDARTQIMKIFDHKTHVSDIIHRCASKRNFKKREKT